MIANKLNQPLKLEYMGYEAMLYPTEKFGYTVNFPAVMVTGTQEDLEKYIMFQEYVLFFMRNLNGASKCQL